MSTAGVAYIELRARLDQFERDLRAAESSSLKTGSRIGTGIDKGIKSKLKGVGSRIGSVLKASALPVAGAVIAGVGVSLKSAADLGEAMNKSAVIFKKHQDRVKDWSETTADAYGISQAQALEAASGFGAMLDTSGVAQGEIAGMSQKMVELAADMASFNNEDPTEMLSKLQSGLAGEAEPLRKFGVLLSEAAVQEEALRMGLVKQGEAMTDAEKVQARYSLMLKQTTKQQGDFGRTSDSMPNQVRRMKASFSDLSAQLGEKLLPIGVKVLEWANKYLPRAFEFLGTAISKIGAVWDGLVEKIGDALGGITDMFASFVVFWFRIAGRILAGADFAWGWMPGVGDKIDELKSDFNRSTNKIVEDLRRQANNFRTWGNDVGETLAEAKANWQGFMNAVGSGDLPMKAAFHWIPDDAKGGGVGAGNLGNNLVSIGRNLQSQGFRVSEHPAFGGVQGGHSSGSYHYAGRAIDINWGPAGQSAEEMAVLTGIGKKLAATVPGIKELLGPWNDPNHRDHLHVAMDTGGWVRGPATVEIGNIRERVHFTPDNTKPESSKADYVPDYSRKLMLPGAAMEPVEIDGLDEFADAADEFEEAARGGSSRGSGGGLSLGRLRGDRPSSGASLAAIGQGDINVTVIAQTDANPNEIARVVRRELADAMATSSRAAIRRQRSRQPY